MLMTSSENVHVFVEDINTSCGKFLWQTCIFVVSKKKSTFVRQKIGWYGKEW